MNIYMFINKLFSLKCSYLKPNLHSRDIIIFSCQKNLLQRIQDNLNFCLCRWNWFNKRDLKMVMCFKWNGPVCVDKANIFPCAAHRSFASLIQDSALQLFAGCFKQKEIFPINCHVALLGSNNISHFNAKLPFLLAFILNKWMLLMHLKRANVFPVLRINKSKIPMLFMPTYGYLSSSVITINKAIFYINFQPRISNQNRRASFLSVSLLIIRSILQLRFKINRMRMTNQNSSHCLAVVK